MTRSKDKLLSEIAEAEACLASIDDQREKVRQRLEALRREFVSVSSRPIVTLNDGTRTGATPMTPADKVRVFRTLFRGRPDVYPTRFVSKKTSRFGYAPACGDKFVPGVCDLPRTIHEHP